MPRVAYGAVLLLLSACGGGGSPSAGGSSAPASSAPGEATSPTRPSHAVPAGNPLDGRAFCAYIAGVPAKMQAAGSTGGALTELTNGVVGWTELHPEQKPRTAADLDEATRTNCPDTRTQALSYLHADSFAAAFG